MFFFYWSLSDTKFLLVSRTLLSIPANLNNAAVWILWFVLRFPTLPVPFIRFWGLFQTHHLQVESPSPSFSWVFLVLWLCLNCRLTFRFLLFSFCVPLGKFNPQDGKFSVLLILLLLLFMMLFYWSLSDSNSPQVSWTILSILAVLRNVVIWMVSTRPPTSRPFNNVLVIVPKTPITIGTIVNFMFDSFFNSLASSR